MSRIIVKNLPLKATEETIKDHFQSKSRSLASPGTITDVKLLKKRDGTSRRFAFIGFKTDEAAENAVSYFHESFMNTSKLDVKIAKELHDDSLVSQWEIKRRKREMVERERQQDGNMGKIGRDSYKKQKTNSGSVDKDSKLAEFLEVMKPQSSIATWKNDEYQLASEPKNTINQAEDGSQDEEYIVDMSKQRRPDAMLHSTSEPPQDDSTDGARVIGREHEREPGSEFDRSEEKSDEPIEENEEQQDNNVSDFDWLRSRQTRIKENGEKPEPVAEAARGEIAGPVDDDDEVQAEAAQTTQPNVLDEIASTGRLFIRNLSYSATVEELEQLFAPFEESVHVHLPTDPKTDKPKGFAFVNFKDERSAATAFNRLDGSIFQGRLLHILPGKAPSENKLDEFDLQNMPLKKRQQYLRRANAEKSQFSWNSLYLNQDAVLETVAAKLGVTKSQMLDPHSANMAVKQALAESSVLQSVQEYFKSKGVDISHFETKETTDKVILVKNIPYGVNIEEIQDLFKQYGDVVRVLMPPEGSLAIVQFKTASAGRAAFSKLAFRRLGNSILYLQKAPEGILEDSDETMSTAEPATPEVTMATKEPVSSKDLLDISKTADETSSGVHTSLFVKNLNFATSIGDLVSVFKPLDGFVTAQIKTKVDAQDKNKRLSLGYGFVEFKTYKQADIAMKALQGHGLDGHSLELRISTRGDDSKIKQPKGSAGTKIVIKNVPFEATKKDITELFGTFGQLRSVRLPTKFNKKTRGFAFAEFATAKEALHAVSSLRGTHLLGRRLVLDFAENDAEDPEEEIARMEAKVRGQLYAEDLKAKRLTGQIKGFDMDEDETAA